VNLKHEITAAVLEKLGIPTAPSGWAYRAWWWPDSGAKINLRLSDLGVDQISKVMTPYIFSYYVSNTGTALKRINKLNTPFYISYHDNTIVIFNDKLAVMARMYPNFERYVELINAD
jgi:hypothetical protein